MYVSILHAVSVPDWFRNETRHGHLLSILQWSHSQTGLGMRLGVVPVIPPSVVSVPDWFRNETGCNYLSVLQCQALEQELQFHKSVYDLQLDYVEMLFDAMGYVFSNLAHTD